MDDIGRSNSLVKTINAAATYFQTTGELHDFHKINLQHWIIGLLPAPSFEIEMAPVATAAPIKIDKKGNHRRVLRKLSLTINMKCKKKFTKTVLKQAVSCLDIWTSNLLKTKVNLMLQINGIMVNNEQSASKTSRDSTKSSVRRRKKRTS